MIASALNPFLRDLAVECELADLDDDGALVPGDDVEWLDDLTDSADALEVWDYAFGQVLDVTLATADESRDLGSDPSELDLTGHGIALIMELFLGDRAGIPIATLSENLKSAALAEVDEDIAGGQWKEWTGAHGDPAALLLGQLAKLSAVTVDDEIARLEPLALNAIAAKLTEQGVHAPVIPPPAEMSADDVVLLAMFGSEDDLAADFAIWTAERTPVGAARELLDFAAGESTAVRLVTVQVAARLGNEADPVFREALDRTELRSYVKPVLRARLAKDAPGQPVPAELEATMEDFALVAVDSFAPLITTIEPKATFPFDMSQVAPEGHAVSPEELFDAIARLDHPDAEAVLTMLGRHCDDKRTAKAARKAACKAASRRPSLRG